MVVFSSEKYIYFSVVLSKHYCLFENHNHQVWLNQWCKFGAVLSLWLNNGRPDFETIYIFWTLVTRILDKPDLLQVQIETRMLICAYLL